jgi:hypothetical protein
MRILDPELVNSDQGRGAEKLDDWRSLFRDDDIKNL